MPGVPARIFTDSRRLLGPSAWLDAPGVILHAPLDPTRGEDEVAEWRAQLSRMLVSVGWEASTSITVDGPVVMLAFTAPMDCLFAATLINEWAWTAAATEGMARAQATLDADEEVLPAAFPKAVARVRELIAAEENPPLLALIANADEMTLPLLVDDELVSVGYGRHSQSWPLRELPAPDAVDWSQVQSIPVALVTGSNGKTTTVRLVAAMLARAGHTVGFCCSDGVYIDGQEVERGDWSGPAGARMVLRNQHVTAAVLETARGGLLRRGLVVPKAAAAIITNIEADHFGDYGVHSLEDLAAAKLLVARALPPSGTLVLNGDDASLRSVSLPPSVKVEWFSRDSLPPNVPPLAKMPLAQGGAAAYNVMNAAGASLVASALGVSDEVITTTLTTFGERNEDNPGRLERFDVGGVRVWLDYAHNPHGLTALLTAAQAARAGGRIGLLLGQAGDREDDAIRALARAAWSAAPDFVVLKDLDGYLRGRVPGEVPGILREELLVAGAAPGMMATVADEISGVQLLLEWAQPGDLLVLPVHTLSARKAAVGLLGGSGENARSTG